MSDVIDRFVSNFARRASRAVKMHPVEILLGLVFAFLLSTAIGDHHAADGPEVAETIMLVIPVVGVSVFAISALHRMRAVGDLARMWMTAAALVAGGVYAWWLTGHPVDAEGWRWMTLAVSAVSAATLVPLAARGFDASRSVRFWRFNARLMSRIAVTTGFLILLFIGLGIGLVAVDALFETSIDGDFVARLAAWLFFAVGPWMVCAAGDDIVDVDRPVPESAIRWIARIGSYLFVPLIGLYLLITYLAGFLVAVTDFAPSNVISPLVLGAGLMGFLGLYLVEPLRHRGDYRFLSRLYQCFPVAFLVVLPLSFWAVLERVNQYGWTEFRYVRFLAILLFAGLCIYGGIQLLRRKSMHLFAVPMVVAMGFFFASAGPGSVVEVSKSSQLVRLNELADDAGVLDADGRIDAEELSSVDYEERSELAEVARYLRRHHGIDSMEGYVPAGVDGDRWVGRIASPRHGHVDETEDRASGRSDSVRLLTDGPWLVKRTGAYTLLDYSSYDADACFVAIVDVEVSSRVAVDVEGDTLTIRAAEDGWDSDWHAEFGEIFDRADELASEQRSAESLSERLRVVPLRDDDGHRVGSVLVQRIVVDTGSTPLEVEHLDGAVVVKHEAFSTRQID